MSADPRPRRRPRRPEPAPSSVTIRDIVGMAHVVLGVARRDTLRGLATAALATLAACAHLPAVDPALAGCYDVRVDSIGAAHRALGIEAPPQVVLIDSLHFGRVLLPEAWLDAARPFGTRRASVSQARPAHTIRDGVLVDTRETGTRPLPRDSMLFTIGFHTASLNARLARDATGNWEGTAWTWPNEAPFTTVRLLRRPCPMERFGIAR